jgi:hypothetical protein
MCNFFALRETLDLLTKQTRITRVIYSPTGDQTETNKNKKTHHNTVFFNNKPWDSLPFASPEGHGTTPSEKCQRWYNAACGL